MENSQNSGEKHLSLVTGASAGIGDAIARELARAGHDLILTGRRAERLSALANEIQQTYKTHATSVVFDVSDHEACKAAYSRHKSLFESVTVLVNNAGLARGVDPVQTAQWQDWNEMIDTNIKGLLSMTRLILPNMIARGEGHIVNMGSVAGRWTYPGGAVYAATKFAVRALSEGIRYDVMGSPIRVTNIEPGMVETEFSDVRFRGDRERAAKVYQGMRPLRPEDIAETVRWCLERPSHVNVQELVIFPTDQASVRDVVRR